MRKTKTIFNNSKTRNVVMGVAAVLLIVALCGGAAALFRNNDKSNNMITVYVVPSDGWVQDESLIGAYVWIDNSNKFVLASDEDEDGVYELTFDKKFKSVIFVDLKPDTNNLGLNWANVREQSSDLDVPTDKNVYYHQYVNEWSDSKEILFNVTTDNVSVKFTRSSTSWAGLNIPVMYVFDKTGKCEGTFITMTQCGDYTYVGDIPAGYTHVIFLEYDESNQVGTWDGVISQTGDLLIPVDDANVYDLESQSWITE